jgi:hypothetical protein
MLNWLAWRYFQRTPRVFQHVLLSISLYGFRCNLVRLCDFPGYFIWSDPILRQISVIIMVMSMGWDYISELLPLTDLLFIPNVIHEHGEPWWNDINIGKLQIPSPELSGNPVSRRLVASRKNWRRKWLIWPRDVFLFIPESDFYIPQNLTTWGWQLYFPFE